MTNGISGASVPAALPYAEPVNSACGSEFWPLLAYAIFWRETIFGETQRWWNACTVISPDGGHGLGQLTSSVCANWQDPRTNARYAVENFLIPARDFMLHKDPALAGEALIRCIAAAYNAGPETAWNAHLEGNVDRVTTQDYASAVAQYYDNLLAQGHP